jgi:hypothetical protein
MKNKPPETVRSGLGPEDILAQLDRCNVVYDTPGRSDRDSMPLGNGEVGASLWVEEDGDLRFYLARTDALTEIDRSVKLGMVRLRLSPNPFLKGQPFLQVLSLRDGAVEISAGDASLRVFVDSDFPVLRVTGTFPTPRVVTATYETWRTAPRPQGGDSAVTGAPPIPDVARSFEILKTRVARCPDLLESADVVQTLPGGVLFYHHNDQTYVPFLAGLEGLAEHVGVIPDPVKDRTFGGWMTLSGSRTAGDGAIETAGPVTAFALKVTTHSAQTPAVAAWTQELLVIHSRAADAEKAAARTADWWRRYWTTSWIFAGGDEDAERVTRAYVLTKWMLAGTARGAFPIRYNGALFNLMPAGDGKISVFTMSRLLTDPPAGEPTLAVNADIRPWSHNNYYQNQRLPYLSMLPRGEADSVRRLFRFYRRFWDLDRVRARVYHDAEGQHSADNTMNCGLLQGGIYGFDRGSHPVGFAVNRHTGGIAAGPGLELLQLMLDYYDYTADREFLRDDLLPYARDVFRYVETRFRERRDGKIVVGPLNAVETYWDCIDPITVVAGMHGVLGRLLGLPPPDVPGRDDFERILAITPPLPFEPGDERLLASARIHDPLRNNVEAPPFYAIFPFRLYGLGKPDLEMARASYEHAAEVAGSMKAFEIGQTPDHPSYSGWQQHGMAAAILGLGENAAEIMAANSLLGNPGCRFPAMWGPIYDAVPDIDHGANLLTTLQLMAFQADGDRILILPAWPDGWDVSFQFMASRGATVTCVYRQGRLEALEVSPPERMKDVEVCRGR